VEMERDGEVMGFALRVLLIVIVRMRRVWTALMGTPLPLAPHLAPKHPVTPERDEVQMVYAPHVHLTPTPATNSVSPARLATPAPLDHLVLVIVWHLPPHLV